MEYLQILSIFNYVKIDEISMKKIIKNLI